MNVTARCFYFVAGFPEVAARNADDRRAFPRKSDTDGLANAPARAGDNHDFVFESHKKH